MKVNRIIRRKMRDSDGSVIGDVNAAVAMNVGEPSGSATHVSSHTRIVQSTRGGQTHTTTTSESTTRAAPSTEADESKEDA